MVVYYKIFLKIIPSQNSKVITFKPNGKKKSPDRKQNQADGVYQKRNRGLEEL